MIKRGWGIPEREATAEEVFLNRRKFMKSMGLAGIGAIAGCGSDVSVTGPVGIDQPANGNGDLSDLYPATLNTAFAELDRPLTDETVAGKYNNFWEFTTGKSVWRAIDDFESRPWTMEVTGLVQNSRTYDIDELIRAMPSKSASTGTGAS